MFFSGKGDLAGILNPIKESNTKRILLALSLVVQFILAGTAFAVPVDVDFSVLGINSVDITTASYPSDWTGYTLDGASFRYDDGGSGIDFAWVDASGVWGTTGGSLIFYFSTAVQQLSFDFSLLGLSSPVSDALAATLFNDSGIVSDVFLSADINDENGDAFAQFAYAGTAFDRVQMYFSPDALFFSVDNISYDTEPAPVPEPAGGALLALGLLGLGGLLLNNRKSEFS